MTTEINGVILAAITTDNDEVGGGMPIFYVKNEDEMQEMAGRMANILDAMVHEITPRTLIIVKH